MRWGAVVFLTSAVIGGPLGAQQLPTTRLYVGGGLEITGMGDGSRFTPGPNLQFGVLSQASGSAFALRFAATYYKRDRGYVVGTPGSERAFGPTVELAWDLGRATWRPYALGGVGVFGVAAPRRAARPAPVTHLAGAWIAGLGIRRAAGATQIFGELRYHYLTNAVGFTRRLLPLTVGVQF